jgi:hypothetical protein
VSSATHAARYWWRAARAAPPEPSVAHYSASLNRIDSYLMRRSASLWRRLSAPGFYGSPKSGRNPMFQRGSLYRPFPPKTDPSTFCPYCLARFPLWRQRGVETPLTRVCTLRSFRVSGLDKPNDERTRTADLILLRVRGQWLLSIARAC